ncbi:dicarboxylate/amino acid:cation symporter [Cytophagaceae bacterium ABcell3]|nr:dicarboxylate/amino acid:cation symporter [Cytophagaceae bacterium ABcell3]
MLKNISLAGWIIIGLVVGLLWGFVASYIGAVNFTQQYIQPFGTIFIRLLQMVAIPLVVSSLITGISRLKDISKLSRMGLRTLLLFFITGTFSILLGLSLVNLTNPGLALPDELRENLMERYGGPADDKAEAAQMLQRHPLTPLVEMVPDNIFAAMSDNGRMLQVVFAALLAGLALVQIPAEKGAVVMQFFEGANELLIKMVGYIMYFAPFGVFALMSAIITETAGDFQLLLALLYYALTVLAGLVLMLLVFYPLLYMKLGGLKYKEFFVAMRPALILAFSTSSSSATLPVTMTRVEKKLGVGPEVAGFVLPLGTTINMDGTALYQAVAAIFIAQVFGFDLSFVQQMVIVLTATLSAVGAAGVPGAGMITLVIVLESVGVPAAGVALIMAPDRILDMCRSIVNVSGDAVASIVMDRFEKKDE